MVDGIRNLYITNNGRSDARIGPLEAEDPSGRVIPGTASGRPIVLSSVLNMIKKLFIIAALVAPGFAYAGNPSADLSVQVVAAGSSSGALPGSILPPGYTWINDYNETFPGPSLDSTWSTSGCAGNTIVVSSGLTIYEASNINWGGTQCAIHSASGFITPGYFEIYWQGDPGSCPGNPPTQCGAAGAGAWWTFNGPLASVTTCAYDPINVDGIEIDPAETIGNTVSQQELHWGGYSSCEQSYNSQTASPFSIAPYNEMGIDFENNSITIYQNGSVTGSYSASMQPGNSCPTGNIDGASPLFTPYCSNGTWLGEFFIGDSTGACCASTAGMHVTWVRHYYHD
jgi:hypothetical protein